MQYNPTKLNLIYLIHMYKDDLVLNNLQWSIYHKTQPNQILASPWDGTQCQQRADERKFLLDDHNWCLPLWESIEHF